MGLWYSIIRVLSPRSIPRYWVVYSGKYATEFRRVPHTSIHLAKHTHPGFGVTTSQRPSLDYLDSSGQFPTFLLVS